MTQHTLSQSIVNQAVENNLFRPRDYQIEAVCQVLDNLQQKKDSRILLKSPTGSGKTLMSSLIMINDNIRQVLTNNEHPLRILFMAHTKTLLTQADRLMRPLEGVYIVNDDILEPSTIDGQQKDHHTEIFFSTVGSNLEIGHTYDLVVIDEAHHESSHSYQKRHKETGHLPHILMTAWESRLDRMVVKYDAVVEPLTREDAVEQGVIARSTINSFVDGSGRDKSDMLNKIMSEFAFDMGRTFVFVRTKKEVASVTNHLQSLGFEAVGLLDQTNDELQTCLDDFSKGDIDFIVNCGRLGEGIDVKGCESVVIGRQLSSTSLMNQIIGRSVRIDSRSVVWELVNALSGTNLDASEVVGEPEEHNLYSIEGGEWVKRTFESGTRDNG